MASHPDYPRTRLYLTDALKQGGIVDLRDQQAHYLLQVLRMKEGDTVALFNGRDGEFLARISQAQKKSASLSVERQLRSQPPTPSLRLLTAPLKNGKTEFVLEKATELGIARFSPVITQFTVVHKINPGRLEAIAREASEQCERLDIPAISPIATLETILGEWPKDARLLYGDESGHSASAKALLPTLPPAAYAVLIGPEGGFSPGS